MTLPLKFSPNCQARVQIMSRSCTSHLNTISISNLYNCNATTTTTFLSEITQISLQESKLKLKGRFRETSEDAHRHGQAKIT